MEMSDGDYVISLALGLGAWIIAITYGAVLQARSQKRIDQRKAQIQLKSEVDRVTKFKGLVFANALQFVIALILCLTVVPRLNNPEWIYRAKITIILWSYVMAVRCAFQVSTFKNTADIEK